MEFLRRGLTQVATLWVVTGVDTFNQPAFADPVVIRCRWEDRNERMQSDDGEEFIARSRIFLEQEVKLGDYLAFGEHVDVNPRSNPLAHRVMAFRRTPSISGTANEFKVYV